MRPSAGSAGGAVAGPNSTRIMVLVGPGPATVPPGDPVANSHSNVWGRSLIRMGPGPGGITPARDQVWVG